jgi:ribonuclease P protein component
MDRALGNEADVQAPQPQAGQQARIPSAHEDEGRPQGAEPSQTAGSGQDHGCGRGQVEGGRDGFERLPRASRIQRSSEVRRVLEVGERSRTACLDVFVATSPVSHSRLGLIVPKLGRRIVDRNLLKRRLREIGRRDLLPALDASGRPLDVLIRARGQAYRIGYSQLALEVREAVEGLCSDEP